jgi:hypothetical protein
MNHGCEALHAKIRKVGYTCEHEVSRVYILAEIP